MKIIKNILLFLALTLWILIINFYFSMKVVDIEIFISYFMDVSLLLLNAIPILIVLIMMYAIFNRLWLSFGFTSFLVFVMGFINRTKLGYRDEPFMPSDLVLLSESIEMTKRYELNFNIVMIIFILLSIAIMFILFRFFSKQKISLVKRWGIVSLIFIISLLGFSSIYHSNSIYNSIGNQSLINVWSASQQYQIRGFIYSFLNDTKTLTINKPINYDEKEVKKFLNNYESENIPSYDYNKKINVISIMLEAFQDFSKMSSLEIAQDVYKDFHNVIEKSYSGTLISNVFGGGTINTERSYLTGFYTMPTFRSKTNSFVHYFKDQNYYTEAMHPIYGWFYNRRNVDTLLGFDNFDYYENKFSNIKDEFLTDNEFFNYIIESYQNRDKNKTYFHFSVTYQNHGPYSTEKLYEEDYLKRNESISDDTYNIINNYLHGVKDTGGAIKKIIEYFEEVEEPVVVLMFSDHNPYLGEDNIGFKEMGINMDISSEEGFKNHYGVPYFIWANNKSKELTGNQFIGKAPTISPLYLMPELFENLGWKGNSYLQYLTELKTILPVFHTNWYKEEGFNTDLSTQAKEALEWFYHVEYYWIKNYYN